MSNILFSSDNLQTFIYVAGNETILDISEKFNVPPHFIIKDNGLKREIVEGDVLIIKKRDGVKKLQPFDMPYDKEAEKIKRINDVTVLYPFLSVVTKDD